jgi:hypothetical protein
MEPLRITLFLVFVPTLSQFFDCMMSSKYGMEIAWKEGIMARLKIFF